MEYLLSAILTSLEFVFFHLFWSAFFSRKVSLSKYLCYFVGLIIISLCYLHLVDNTSLELLFAFVLHLLSAKILYYGKTWQHMIAIVFAIIIGSMIDVAVMYGTCALLQVSLEDFVWRVLSYSVTAILGKLVSVLIAWLIKQIRQARDLASSQYKWLLLSLLFPIVSYMMLIVIFDSHAAKNDMSMSAFLFTCVLIIANMGSLYLINMLVRSERTAKETALMRQQMDIQTDSILALEKNYRTQRQTVHEFQHQLQTIQDLLSGDSIEAAKKYVNSLQETQSTRILAVNSHHPIIDAILNHKYQMATEKQIDMQIQVNDLSTVDLSIDALVVLLSNLLDNAIEACLRTNSAPSIDCSVLNDDDLLFISISNTSLPVTIIDDTIQTSKVPKQDHGYGLLIIRHILMQHNAEYTFTYNDGWFHFAAEIPIK